MPDKVVEVPGVGNVAFPDSMTDDQIAAQISKGFSGQGTAAPSWAAKLGITNPVAKAGTDIVEGAASGAASTLFHAGDLLRRGEMGIANALGVDPKKLPQGVRDFFGLDRVIDQPGVQQAMTAPSSIPGQIGKFGEQAAEFLLPGSIATEATKGAALLPRAIAQGVAAAGTAGAQTGGQPGAMATAAGLGAGGEALSAAVESPAVQNYLREAAEKQYAKAINATKQGNKWISQNIAVPELLDRGVSAFTLKGLAGKATNNVQAFGQAIDDAWKALPAGTTAEIEPILNTIESSAKNALTIMDSTGRAIPITQTAAKGLDSIDFLKQTLRDVSVPNPATGNLEVPVEKLRQLRQAWDEIAAQAKVYKGADLADAATGKLHAMAASAIRDQLAQDFPDIAALNKEFSFWKNVEQVVNDTVLRREGQAKPLGRKIAGAAGIAFGGATGGLHGAIVGKQAMEGLEALTSSTMWRTVSAVQKNNLAKYLASGNRTAAEMTIRQMIKAAGLEAGTEIANSESTPAAAQPAQ